LDKKLNALIQEFNSYAQHLDMQIDLGEEREPELDEDANGMFEGTEREIKKEKVEEGENVEE